MPASNAGRAPGTIVIEHEFRAPREDVFQSWTRASEVQRWFAPEGYTVTSAEVDARPGGRWRVEFRSEDGISHTEYGEFEQVDAPARLVLTLTQRGPGGREGPRTRVSVTFLAREGGTLMRFEQSGYVSKDMQDGNAEGWNECFGKLDRALADQAHRTERTSDRWEHAR
jgi:uncharacterized protein YndB with AHSA1/START domain